MGPYHDRLQHPDRLDARGEVLHWLLVERRTRLTRVGIDMVDTQLLKDWTGGLFGVLRLYRLLVNCLDRWLAVILILRAAWDQRVQSTAKAATASHQLAPSPVGASKPLRSASSKVRSR
jgi:hypothetical protein